MKPILTIILISLLAACGGGGDEDPTEPTEKISDPAPPASAPVRN